MFARVCPMPSLFPDSLFCAQAHRCHDFSRSRDIIDRRVPFPIDGPFERSLYLWPFSRYLHLNISRARPCPVRVRDVIGHVTIIPHVPFPIGAPSQLSLYVQPFRMLQPTRGPCFNEQIATTTALISRRMACLYKHLSLDNYKETLLWPHAHIVDRPRRSYSDGQKLIIKLLTT